jgi:hypothetical protein
VSDADLERAYLFFGANLQTRQGGFFQSTNRGGSWSAVNSGLGKRLVYSLAIDPGTSITLYAGTNRGVFKSTNSGGS